MSADLKPYQNSLVRILDAAGVVHGMGYLCEPRVVMTCAHVVAQCLGADAQSHQPPEGSVQVDRPFAKTPPVQAKVVPRGWHASIPAGRGVADVPADLAVLLLDQALVDVRTAPAIIASAHSIEGLRFTAYGAIEGHENEPVPLAGEVNAQRGDGRYTLITAEGDYRVAYGCSGSPAADRESGQVIGLVVQTELDPRVRAGFMIPAAHLRSVLRQARPGLPVLAAGTALGALRRGITHPAKLPDPELAMTLKRFIDHYTDHPANRVPFVGREAELASLDRWVEAGDSQVMLVSSPAGRGKSALLLHWLARAEQAGDETTRLFVPISIRFGTNDEERGLRLIYNMLCGVFAELKLQTETRADIADYRDRINQGWAMIEQRPEQRYVLVVDGLDEATGDWVLSNVLPYEPPPNFKILLAARHEPGQPDGASWLAKLNLSPYSVEPRREELDCLTREAVADAVAYLGHPLDGLVESETILDRLYTLTDNGDPLLIALWVKQLWEARADAITARSLADYQPGFAGFYNVWREGQNRLWVDQGMDVNSNDLDRLLEVLAIAEGPLYLKDLLDIQHQLKTQSPACMPVVWGYEKTRDVLGTAHRLLIGDGERAPYTFVHPRLNDYFNERPVGQRFISRQKIERGFCAWGRHVVTRLNEGVRAPKDCPEYLLRHYTRHVNEAGLNQAEVLTDYLLPLMDGGWHRAWVNLVGAYGGFLNDIDSVWQALRKHNRMLYEQGAAGRLWVGEELGCLLIFGSIRALVENLPPELIIALVASQVWTVERGARVAAELPDAQRRVAALLGVVGRSRDPQRRAVYLNQALAAARLVEYEEERIELLSAVAGRLAAGQRREVLKEALSLSCASEDERDRADALSALVERLSDESALLSAVVAQARAMRGEWNRFDVLMAVAGQLRDGDELLDEVVSAVDTLDDEGARADVLLAMAPRCSGERRDGLVNQALSLARRIEDEWDRAKTLVAVAGQLAGQAQTDVLAEALSLTRATEDESERAEICVAVAELSTGMRRSELLAEAVASACVDADADTLALVAGHLVGESALLKRVLSAAADLADEWHRADVLTALAASLSGAPGVLAEALALAQGIGDEESRAEVLATLAGVLTDTPELLAKALSAVRTFEDDDYRVQLLASVAGQLAGAPELLPEALSLTRTLEDGEYRFEVLSALAEPLGEAPEVLDQALRIAREIEEPWSCAKALAIIAARLSADRRRDVLTEVLSLTRLIQNGDDRADALTAIASQAPIDPEQLTEALSIARAIGDDWRRADTLLAMAGQLDAAQRGDVVASALSAARDIGDQWNRVNTLAAVAAECSEAMCRQVLDEALSVARVIEDEQDRVGALADVADRLQGAARRDVLTEALNIALGVVDDENRTQVLCVLVSHMTVESGLMARLLLAARELEDIVQRADVLSAVVGQLSDNPGALAELVSMAVDAEGGWSLAELLFLACNLEDEEERASVLSSLARQLSPAQHEVVWNDVLTAVRAIEDDWNRTDALAAVASQLTGLQRRQVLAEALQLAVTIEDEQERGGLLEIVVSHLSGEPELLAQVLTTVNNMEDEWSHTDVLSAVAAQLSSAPQLSEEVLSVARTVEWEWSRAKLLSRVAGQLTGQQQAEVLDEALCAARAIEDHQDRADALLNVARQLGESRREEIMNEALSEARAIEESWERADLLLAAAAHLPPVQRRVLVAEAVTVAEAIEDGEGRAELLLEIAESLEGESELIKRACDAAENAAFILPSAFHLTESDDYHLISSYLGTLKHQSRDDVLTAIEELAASINRFGGEHSILGTCYWIRATAREWS